MPSSTLLEQIGDTTFNLVDETQLVATRSFAAPRQVMWQAWTDSAFPPLWMTGPPGWTMPVCEIDLVPGGKWHFEWRQENGETMAMEGTYVEITPPERLVNTERWGGDWPETTHTLELLEEEGGTQAVATVEYPNREARDKAIATGMCQGWAMSYDKLAAHVEEAT